MSEAEGYRPWPRDERPRVKLVNSDVTSALRRLLPVSRRRFERLLAAAMAEAARHGSGFWLPGFVARRALGRDLVIDIDPGVLRQRLDHLFRQGDEPCDIRDRFIGAGDWTPVLRGLRNSSTHREVAEIVAAGFDYRRTASYRKALERAAVARPVKRNFVVLSSPAKIEAYFRRSAEMCRSIGQSGVLRRADQGRRLASFATPSVRLPWVELGEVDVGVAVGSGGELYRFAAGKHRTAAAQVLNIASIPVEVRLVHADWLARQITDTGLSPTAALLHGIARLGFNGLRADAAPNGPPCGAGAAAAPDGRCRSGGPAAARSARPSGAAPRPDADN